MDGRRRQAGRESQPKKGGGQVRGYDIETWTKNSEEERDCGMLAQQLSSGEGPNTPGRWVIKAKGRRRQLAHWQKKTTKVFRIKKGAILEVGQSTKWGLASSLKKKPGGVMRREVLHQGHVGGGESARLHEGANRPTSDEA